MKLFRIVKTKYATNIQDVFNGDGAKKYGGRWNSLGHPCVYLAGSESLAILEILAHTNTSAIIASYSLFSIEIDDQHITELANSSLPSDWQDYPAPPSTALIGDQWLASNQSPILSLPSTIVVRERNYLLNVKHPASPSIVSATIEMPFALDPRLSKS